MAGRNRTADGRLTKASWEKLPRRRFAGAPDGEIQWRTGLGLLLLTGLVSLSVEHDAVRRPASVDASQAVAWQALWAADPGVARETTRSGVMDGPHTTPRLEPSPEAVTANGPVSAVGLPLSSEDAQRLSLSRLIAGAEALIRRYPWPTILLGMAVGFLLARRVR